MKLWEIKKLLNIVFIQIYYFKGKIDADRNDENF